VVVEPAYHEDSFGSRNFCPHWKETDVIFLPRTEGEIEVFLFDRSECTFSNW